MKDPKTEIALWQKLAVRMFQHCLKNIWKQTRYPKVRDWLNKSQPIHTLKCASGIKADTEGVFLNIKSYMKTGRRV